MKKRGFVFTILLVVVCLNMFSQTTKSVVTKTIEPAGWSNIPVVSAEYVKGGLHSVASITDRDAITIERRSIGMLCYVIDANGFITGNQPATYRLVDGVLNINWVEQGSATLFNTHKIVATGILSSVVNSLSITGEATNEVGLNINGSINFQGTRYITDINKIYFSGSDALIDNVKTINTQNISATGSIFARNILADSNWDGSNWAINFDDINNTGKLKINVKGSLVSNSLSISNYSRISDIEVNQNYITTFTTADLVIDPNKLTPLNNNKTIIKSVAAPVNAEDAANKEYVDNIYFTKQLSTSESSDCRKYSNFKISVNSNYSIVVKNYLYQENYLSKTYTWFIQNTSSNQISVTLPSNFVPLEGSSDTSINSNKVMILVGMSDGVNVYYSAKKTQ